MRREDFQIGNIFYLSRADGVGKWRCTDVGTRTILAIRVDKVTGHMVMDPDNPARIAAIRTLNEQEAEAQGFFNGPPYHIAENVFDEDDMTACRLTADEK